MRHGAGQANPDPPSSGSPSAQRRRRGWRRWWLVLMPLPPLAVGVFGWLDPSEAWRGVWVLPVATAMHIAQAWEEGDIPERARPRWIAGMIGYTVLCVVAGFVGAWLAR
jgi:hypothetical protein